MTTNPHQSTTVGTVITVDGQLAILLPDKVARSCGFQHGNHVQISTHSEGLTIATNCVDIKMDPSEPLSGDDLHRDVYWGTPSDREVIND